MDDPKVRQPDITRARQMLGWEPQVQPRGRAATSSRCRPAVFPRLRLLRCGRRSKGVPHPRSTRSRAPSATGCRPPKSSRTNSTRPCTRFVTKPKSARNSRGKIVLCTWNRSSVDASAT